MHPRLFSPFGFDIYSYGFMLMVGFILAIYVTTKRARLAGIKPEFITDLAIWAIILGVVGARIAYVLEWKSAEAQKPFVGGWKIFNVFDGNVSVIGAVLGLLLLIAFFLLYNHYGKTKITFTNENGLRAGVAIAAIIVSVVVMMLGARAWVLAVAGHYMGGSNPVIVLGDTTYNLEYFAIRSGGLTFYGGFVPAALALVIVTWLRKYNPWKVGDIIMPSAMLGLAFGRIGCFLNGCCWGDVCETGVFSNIAVRFPKNSNPFQSQNLNPEVATASLPVIPTQLIESFFTFGLFLFLGWYIGRKRAHGEVVALGAGLYAIGRFLIEFLRADHTMGWFGLSFSQNISMGVFVVAVCLFFFLRSRKSPLEVQRETVERQPVKF